MKSCFLWLKIGILRYIRNLNISLKWEFIILFINACVRETSRTKNLANNLLKNLEDEIEEINLEKENIQPLNWMKNMIL